jgi:hypothetical protein
VGETCWTGNVGLTFAGATSGNLSNTMDVSFGACPPFSVPGKPEDTPGGTAIGTPAKSSFMTLILLGSIDEFTTDTSCVFVLLWNIGFVK